MFNLEEAIQTWKRSLKKSPAFEEGQIKEMETHLRDEIDSFIETGFSEQVAFKLAKNKFGNIEELEDDVYKAKTVKKIDATPPWKQSSWIPGMLPNYLKVTLRTIWNNKLYAGINLFGLATGIAASLLILIYVQYEQSYDTHHPNSERLYRVITQNVNSKGSIVYADAMSFNMTGPSLKEDLSAVQEFARVRKFFQGLAVLIDEQHSFLEMGAIAADPSFFTLFNYPVVQGRGAEELKEPYTAILTESKAKTFFGDVNAIDKTFRITEGLMAGDYTVKGIIKNVSENTHLPFDMALSFQTLFSAGIEPNWTNFIDYTYVRLAEGTNPDILNQRLKKVTKRYLGDNATLEHHLQPVEDIHLHSNLSYEAEVNGSSKAVYFLTVIAFLIGIIAWVNYVNLATARAVNRAKEVGLRKTFGSERYQLITQFLFESALTNLMALLVAVLFIHLFLPYFSNLTGSSLVINWSDLLTWKILALIWAAGSAATGFYPAVVLSAFEPIEVLKGEFKNTSKGILLRKALVVFQFAISVFLIAGTAIVYYQIEYMKNKDLGMNVNQVLVLRSPQFGENEEERAQSSFTTFRAAINQMPTVKSITSSVSIPASGSSNIGSMSGGFWWEENITDEQFTYYRSDIDEGYFDTYQIDLIAGRNFSRDIPTDTGNVFIANESAINLMGIPSPEEAIGARVVWGSEKDNNGRIIGVIKDFNRQSLKYEIEPTLYFYDLSGNMNYFSIRIADNNVAETVNRISEVWDRIYPQSPFEFFFADDRFNAQYQNEQRFGKIFVTFSILAILIACLGLYGLTSYMANQRRKEMGVRKVLGATPTRIVYLFSIDFLKLILVSLLIAIPAVYLIMGQWLNSFAYQTPIKWWYFLLSGLAIMLVVFSTISFQIYKLATLNPAKNLKSE